MSGAGADSHRQEACPGKVLSAKPSRSCILPSIGGEHRGRAVRIERESAAQRQRLIQDFASNLVGTPDAVPPFLSQWGTNRINRNVVLHRGPPGQARNSCPVPPRQREKRMRWHGP